VLLGRRVRFRSGGQFGSLPSDEGVPAGQDGMATALTMWRRLPAHPATRVVLVDEDV